MAQGTNQSESELRKLIKAAKAKDPAAITALYERARHKVYLSAVMTVKNPDDALDIMQETFITALNKLGTLKSPEAFDSWILTISRNKCLNFLKKRKDLLVDQEYDGLFEGIPGSEEFLPQEALERSDLRNAVLSAVKALSAPLSQSVMYYYFDNLTIAEISKAMSCPMGTVSRRLSIARAQIKQSLTAAQTESPKQKGREHAMSTMLAAPILSLILKNAAETGRYPGALSETKSADCLASILKNVRTPALIRQWNSLGAQTVTGTKLIAVSLAVTAGVIGGVYLFMPNKPPAGTQAAAVITTQSPRQTTGGTAAFASTGRGNTTPPAASFGTTLIAESPANNATTTPVAVGADAKPATTGKSAPMTGADQTSTSGSGVTSASTATGQGITDITTATTEDQVTTTTSVWITTTSARTSARPATTTAPPVLTTDFEYTLDATGAVITGYTGSGGAVSVPGILEGRPVYKIGANAFSYCAVLQSVYIPGSVRTIESSAFLGCDDLTVVNFAQGTQSIQDYSFYFCSNLSTVSLPDSLLFIGDRAFAGCDFASVTIPQNVAEIGWLAFDNLPFNAYFEGSPPITDTPFSAGTVVYHRGYPGFTNPWKGYETRFF